MTSILSLTGGHRVDHDAFWAMLGAICSERGWRYAHAVQPTGQRWLGPDTPWDAILCHDIPGLHLTRGEPPRPIDPSDDVRAEIEGLFASGTGLVIVHHALAAWPSWDRWADAVGGRFLYAPGTLHGSPWPSSGTRIDTYTARVVAADHPVCAGIDDFTLTDELYCCPVFEHDVVPLIETDADMNPDLFISTYEHVIVGEEAAPRCTGHPPPSRLLAWATSAGNSPIVFVQPGDTAATFARPEYRRLIGNALAWVCSESAKRWAEGRSSSKILDNDSS